MKSDFKQKKKKLKEKALILTSIVLRKNHEIDLHISSLKIFHKKNLTKADEGKKETQVEEEEMKKLSDSD